MGDGPRRLAPPKGTVQLWEAKHDSPRRSTADRTTAAVGPRSGGGRRRSGAPGRQVRRDVDLHELHLPVVQLPQPAGSAAVLRPAGEHRGRGVRAHRARFRRHQHDAHRRCRRHTRQGRRAEGRQGHAQHPALHRRRRRGPRPGLHGQAVERGLRLLLGRPHRGPDAQLLPRDRSAQQQAQGLRDGRPSRSPRADRLSARPRRRAPGRLRTRAGEPHRGTAHEALPLAADPDRQDPRVQAAHQARRAPQALPLLDGRLQGDRRRLQRAAPRDRRTARGRRRGPARGRAGLRPAAADRGLRAGARSEGDRRDRGQAPPGRRPAQGAHRRRGLQRQGQEQRLDQERAAGARRAPADPRELPGRRGRRAPPRHPRRTILAGRVGRGTGHRTGPVAVATAAPRVGAGQRLGARGLVVRGAVARRRRPARPARAAAERRATSGSASRRWRRACWSS